MDSKYLVRVFGTILILLLIVWVVHAFIYSPYSWELTGVVSDAEGNLIKGVEVQLTHKESSSLISCLIESVVYNIIILTNKIHWELHLPKSIIIYISNIIPHPYPI